MKTPLLINVKPTYAPLTPKEFKVIALRNCRQSRHVGRGFQLHVEPAFWRRGVAGQGLRLVKYLRHLLLVLLAPGELVVVEAWPECFQQLLRTGPGAVDRSVNKGVPLATPRRFLGRRAVAQLKPSSKNRLYLLPHEAPNTSSITCVRRASVIPPNQTRWLT